VVQATGAPLNQNVNQTVSVACPAGKTALAGGWETTATRSVWILDSMPSQDGSAWAVRWRQSDANGRTLTAFAICAVVT
jgi:hypothetical protein